jgi:hypothetical protein
VSKTGAIELCSAIRGADTITTVCPDNDSQWSTLDGCQVARRAIAARL